MKGLNEMLMKMRLRSWGYIIEKVVVGWVSKEGCFWKVLKVVGG